MADPYEMSKRIDELERRLQDLRRNTSHLPLHVTAGNDSLLPPGGKKFFLLQRGDDAELTIWARPRFILEGPELT